MQDRPLPIAELLRLPGNPNLSPGLEYEPEFPKE